MGSTVVGPDNFGEAMRNKMVLRFKTYTVSHAPSIKTGCFRCVISFEPIELLGNGRPNSSMAYFSQKYQRITRGNVALIKKTPRGFDESTINASLC